MRGYYFGKRNMDIQAWAVRVEHDGSLAPFARSRMDPEDRVFNRTNETWGKYAEYQKDASEEDPNRKRGYRRVPTVFSAPRMMPLRPKYRTSSQKCEDMDRWIDKYNESFNPYVHDRKFFFFYPFG